MLRVTGTLPERWETHIVFVSIPDRHDTDVRDELKHVNQLFVRQVGQVREERRAPYHLLILQGACPGSCTPDMVSTLIWRGKRD